MALVRLAASVNTDTDGMSDVSINCLTPAAAPTGGGRDEDKSPTVPHLLDSLAVPLNADGVNAVSINSLTPAAASTSESHGKREVPDVSRLWDCRAEWSPRDVLGAGIDTERRCRRGMGTALARA